MIPRQRVPSTPVTGLVSVLVAAAVLGGLSACSSSEPNGPSAVAARFADALEDRDLARAGQETDDPGGAESGFEAAFAGLQAEELDVSLDAMKVNPDNASVGYTYTWTLPPALDGSARTWEYSGHYQLAKNADRWQVRWNSIDIHPTLGATQTMALRATAAPTASVNESSGSDILVPGVVHRISLDPSKIVAPDTVAKVAAKLVPMLKQYDSTLDIQSLAERATGSDYPTEVATVTADEYKRLRGIGSLPGVVVSEQADLIATDRGFAPDLVGQIKKQVLGEVNGLPGWRVVTVNTAGADVEVLTEVAPQPSPSIPISLARPLQDAAQTAVDATSRQAMMVVLQPSTGKVLAVAQNSAADRDGPVATAGLYPPGSTFKIITSAAAMKTGLATTETIVGCPGTIEIADRLIPNYNKFTIGSVPMRTAFAASCNTSFAYLASKMGPNDLNEMANALGIGPDFSMPGLPTNSGSVPPTDNIVERTEDGFGQGKVVTSTFGMAIAAATIAHGSAVTPQLMLDRPTEVEGVRPEIPQSVIDGLRVEMREVVVSGTARRIADQGEIYGKTGEAEVENGSHAWFVGYRGDLAFATLVTFGGSSDNAVAVTKDFLRLLPAGW